jgi:hypothetical protein
MGWLTTSTDRSLDTLLPLYAMSTVGSIFADRENIAVGKLFADRVPRGSTYNTGRFTLSVVITRLLLSLYKFAKREEGAAWDYCTLASRAVVALHYDTEEECLSSHDQLDSALDFGLTTQQLVECRRRTCWTSFLMKRHAGLDTNMLWIVATARIHLLLPCAELYESGVPSTASYFDGGASDLAAVASMTSTVLSPMPWLIMVGSIFENAMNYIFRISNHPQSAFRKAYAKTHDTISTALCDWESLVPGHLKYSEANVDRGFQAWYAGTFVSMHALQQFVLMKLYHHTQQGSIPDLASRNTYAAPAMLITCSKSYARCNRQCAILNLQGLGNHNFSFSISTPFAGYAVLLAIDTLSTSGPAITPAQTWESMSGGLASLRELAPLWSSKLRQSRVGEQYLLQRVPHGPSLACHFR